MIRILPHPSLENSRRPSLDIYGFLLIRSADLILSGGVANFSADLASTEIRAGAGGPTGMMAEELRTFSRVIRGLTPVPAGASYQDAIQVQRWMDKLTETAENR